MSEILLAENDWLAQNALPGLEAVVGPVAVVEDFAGVVGALDIHAAGGNGELPLIVLDPGIPDVCRFEAVRRTLEVDSRARIVVWTGTHDAAFLAMCMLDGALASITKRRPIDALCEAIGRATYQHYTCDPEVAQWFLDFLLYLLRCHARLMRGQGSHIWTDAQLADLDVDAQWLDRLEDLAAGDTLGDDRWFAEMIDFVRRFWFDPYLQRSLTALAIASSRSEAAAMLEKNEKTFHGDCSRLAARLMPDQYPADEVPDRAGGLNLASWILVNHAGCELGFEEHVRLIRAH